MSNRLVTFGELKQIEPSREWGVIQANDALFLIKTDCSVWQVTFSRDEIFLWNYPVLSSGEVGIEWMRAVERAFEEILIDGISTKALFCVIGAQSCREVFDGPKVPEVVSNVSSRPSPKIEQRSHDPKEGVTPPPKRTD